MTRRLSAACLALSLLCVLPGCRTPGWVAPINPWKDDDMDRGREALKARDYVMALEFYGQVAANEPDNMPAHYRLAMINQELGRLEEAYRLYRVVYVSGSEDDAPLPNGESGDEPLFRAAERNIRLLAARLGKGDARMDAAKPAEN